MENDPSVISGLIPSPRLSTMWIMKLGFSAPLLTKRLAARTSWNRVVGNHLGLKALRGWVTNRRRAANDRIDNRTPVDLCSLGWRRTSGGLLSLMMALIPVVWVGYAFAGHPGRVNVPFSIVRDVGYGNEVFVAGPHHDLSCGGLMPNGVKLAWSAGNVWSGEIALEAGAQVAYGFYSHSGSSTAYCNGASVLLGSTQVFSVPVAAGPPYAGKVIRYATGWNSVTLIYRDNTLAGPWTNALLSYVAQGRSAGEGVFEVESTIPPGDEIEFVFTDGSGHYDNAPAPPQNTPQGAAPAIPVPYQSLSAPYNYRTSLDVFWVQDGQLFTYPPPAAVSSPAISNRFVNSTVAGIPGRNIHIYVPRGYTENTTRRYPVVYFHDGQNVFFPGGTFGTWDADRIATYETRMGRMRESILVAVDNGNDYGSDRMKEYLPPTDSLNGTTGVADKYVQFLHDNVMPTLDYNYRTLNEPGQPSVPAANVEIGSSLGGLVSTYIGVTQSGLFGKIGVFSPAFWAGPNFRNGALVAAGKLPLRIYLDIGSNESSASEPNPDIYWADAFGVYNDWLGDGYAVNAELLFYPECGGVHSETSWSRRLPMCYRFLLDPWDEANRLSATRYPPRLEMLSITPGTRTAQLRFLAPLGVVFSPWHSPDLLSWTNQAPLSPSSNLWERRTIDALFPTNASRHYWRLEY